MKSSFSLVLILIAISGVSYLTIFKNLGDPQIRMWDEATYANNSIDFFENHNFISVTHLGATDWYNTKPPFVIWTQGIAMKIFGINEFAVRIPSALFGLLTALLVFTFCWQVLKSKLIGFFAAIILLTSNGYIAKHVVLTGDLDSSLVFWLTLGLFTFLFLIIAKPQSKKLGYLILTLSLVFGFLSKGIAGFFFVPAMIIIFFISNNFRLFKGKQFYFSILFALIFCAGYYFLRESQTPGYLKVVWNSEIMRFGDEIMSWHIHPFDFYFKQMVDTKFTPYIYFLVFVFPVFFIIYNDKVKFHLMIYLLISATFYFLLISYPSIKLEWYDAPLYPILAIVVSFIYFELFNFIFEKTSIRIFNQRRTIILSIFGLLLFIYPLNQTLQSKKLSEDWIYVMEFEGAYAKNIVENHPEIKELTVYKVEKNIELFDQILFYKRAYETQGALKIKITDQMNFALGENVMVHKEEDKSSLFQTFKGEIVNQWKDGVLFKIEMKQ